MSFLALGYLTVYSQSPELKHSYTFDDGTAKDVVGNADGNVIGGTFENGIYVTSEQGQYIELPAGEIKINEFENLTLEAYVVAGEKNPEFTMLSFFGNIAGSFGADYIFQSMTNRSQTRSAISTGNYSQPWSAESIVFCNELQDGKPHYVVTTFDDNEVKLYVDGYFIGSTTNDDHPTNLIANLGTQVAYLAKGGYSGDGTWLGKIDEFNIYDGILNEEQITQRAKDYLPDWDIEEVKNQVIYRDLIVDKSGQFDTPITGKKILFTEIIPTDKAGDRWVDQMLVFSDGEIVDWDDYSTMIRTSIYADYLDVANGFSDMKNEDTKIPVDIDYVYQCWIALDVPANTYTVYAKTLDMDEPALIFENAAFKEKVSSLTQWNLIHNRRNDDALTMNTIATVSNIGDFPEGYIPSKNPAFSIAEDVIPTGATVIDNPISGMKRGRQELQKLVLTDSTTELYFHTPYRRRYWIMIPKETFIRVVGSNEKLFIKRAEGITIGSTHHTPSYGYSEYKLVFPALPNGTDRFDYGEANEGGNWFISDIKIKSTENLQSGVYGNWFNSNTGDWELSVLEDHVVYDSKVWNLDNPITDKKKGTIQLSDGSESLSLNYKIKKGQLSIGTSKNNLTTLDHVSNYTNVPNPSNPSQFEVPIFKMDTATLSGHIKGYSPRFGSKTATVYVDNILTGDQENYLLELADNGTFSLKIPMTYPQGIYVRSDFGIFTGPFLEPGEETFIMVDPANQGKNLFMGKNARLCADDQAYENEFGFRNIYNEYTQNILDQDADEFKAFCLEKQTEDLALLDEMFESGKISDRYYQVMKKYLTYFYLRDILHYHYTLDGAKRRTGMSIEDRTEMPTEAEFYDFLTDELLNDELAVLANPFENFMNAFMFPVSTALGHSGQFNHFFDLSSLQKYLPNSERFSKEFEEAEIVYQKLSKPKNQYLKDIEDLRPIVDKEHASDFQEYYKNHSEDYRWRVDFVTELSKADTISDEVKKYCEITLAYFNDPMVIQFDEYERDHKAVIKEVDSLYGDYIPSLYSIKLRQDRTKLYQDKLGIEPGFAVDIIHSQTVLRPVVSELTPMEQDKLDIVVEATQTPFVKKYFKAANEATKAKIEANKNNGDYKLNDVPETEADKVFDAIVSKYKGKVIYVDFWATWCGPCRSSMKNQTPMKEKLMKEGKDIVFLYITNPSSPETTYNNMIPNIKGEHYRVSQDEWNYLASKFNISGIPHYAIVNKKGEVVDGDAPREPSVLVPKFEELMSEE